MVCAKQQKWWKTTKNYNIFATDWECYCWFSQRLKQSIRLPIGKNTFQFMAKEKIPNQCPLSWADLDIVIL